MLDQAGRSLALSLYLPVLALSPLLIWAIERRLKSPSAPFLILCSVLTPLLVVALRLGAVRNLLPPSPDVPQWREPLVPVMWGGVVYGLALSRRGIRARLLVVLIAAAVTLGFISVSSSWRTICDALPSSTFLRAALETLEAKLFGVGCVLLVAAAVAAWMRLRGRSGSVSAGLDAMVLAVAIPILLFSRVFPRKWGAAEIRGISLVRLEPNGDLILDAQWTELSARPSEMPAVATLLRRSGATSLECVYPGPASPAGPDRILVRDGRWWRLALGQWYSLKILDPIGVPRKPFTLWAYGARSIRNVPRSTWFSVREGPGRPS